MDKQEIIKQLKELREQWFEQDSGDGFGRSTDEEIEFITEWIMKNFELKT